MRYEVLGDDQSVYRARQKGLLVQECARTYRLVDFFAGAEVFVMENVPQLLGSAEHYGIAEVA